MSTLISSAVGGKKAAAPKGAVRRRAPPPPGAPAKAATPIPVSSAQNSVAPPSPPPTQFPDAAAHVPSPGLPAPSPPARTSPAILPPPSQSRASRQAHSKDSSVPTDETAAAAAGPQSTTREGEGTSERTVATSSKRKHDAAPAKDAARPARRAKRSSTRSNDQVQTVTQQSEADEPSVPRSRAPLTRASKASSAATGTTESDQSPTQSKALRFQLTPSTKRKRGQTAAEEPPQPRPTKRARRSAASSNDKVQTTVQEEGTPLAAVRTSSQKAAKSTRSKAQSSGVAPTTTPTETAATKKTRTKRKETAAATQEASVEPKKASSARKSQKNLKDTAAGKKVPAKRKSKQTAPTTVTNADGADNVADTPEQQSEAQQAAPKPKRKYRRRKKAQEKQGETPGEGVEGREEHEANDDSESDPELHEIDPNTVTMWEVGGDKRHGKTSEREKKMAEIDWTEVARKRREEIEMTMARDQAAPTADGVVETTEGPGGTAETREQPAAPDTNARPMRFNIVNGEIVENEQSLTINRRAEVEAEVAQSTDPIEEETDLTVRINRTTYLNARRREPADRVPMWKAKSDPWSEEETDRFYDALKMFGTDFFIISKMFPPKTRRQIKTKFVREERLDPQRVDNALMGMQTKPMDLEHYAREVGRDVSEFTKYAGIVEAVSAIKDSFAEREREMEALREQARLEDEAMAVEEGQRAKKAEGAVRKGQGKRDQQVGKTLDKGPKAPRAPRKSGGGGRKKKGQATIDGGGTLVPEVVAVADG